MNDEQAQYPLKEPRESFWSALQQKKTDVLAALQLMEKGVIAPNSLRVVAIRLDKGEFESVADIKMLIREADAAIPGYHWEVTEDDRAFSVILQQD